MLITILTIVWVAMVVFWMMMSCLPFGGWPRYRESDFEGLMVLEDILQVWDIDNEAPTYFRGPWELSPYWRGVEKEGVRAIEHACLFGWATSSRVTLMKGDEDEDSYREEDFEGLMVLELVSQYDCDCPLCLSRQGWPSQYREDTTWGTAGGDMPDCDLEDDGTGPDQMPCPSNFPTAEALGIEDYNWSFTVEELDTWLLLNPSDEDWDVLPSHPPKWKGGYIIKDLKEESKREWERRKEIRSGKYARRLLSRQ